MRWTVQTSRFHSGTSQETDYVQWSGAPACSASVECGAQVLSSSHVPQRAWGNCGAAREVGVRDECGGQSLHHGFVVTISLVAAVLGESVWLDLLSGREGLPCPDVAPGIQRRKPHRFRCSLRVSMFSLIRKRNRSRLPSKVAYRVTRTCPVLFLHTGPLNCPSSEWEDSSLCQYLQRPVDKLATTESSKS